MDSNDRSGSAGSAPLKHPQLPPPDQPAPNVQNVLSLLFAGPPDVAVPQDVVNNAPPAAALSATMDVVASSLVDLSQHVLRPPTSSSLPNLDDLKGYLVSADNILLGPTLLRCISHKQACG